jgi:DnaJ-class molecular chaperone
VLRIGKGDRCGHYEVLGIVRGASLADIKRAYRRLARCFHPDVNPDDAGCEERFKEVTEAREVLRDSALRHDYDDRGDSPFRLQGGQRQWGVFFDETEEPQIQALMLLRMSPRFKKYLKRNPRF